MEGNLIRVRNLERSYPLDAGQFFALRRIHLDVNEGDFVTIMGPSGAGKSTLLSILGMLDGEWRGEYFFLDHAVHKLKPKERAELGKRNIGFVFQQYHLLNDLTVAENLGLPLLSSRSRTTKTGQPTAKGLSSLRTVG